MNTSELRPSAQARWRWIAAVAAVVVAAVLVAVWLLVERPTAEEQADCAVVADVARQWQATVDSLTSARGEVGPSRQLVDDQYTQMAAMVGTAADSVTTPEIKQHLSEWATAAHRLAMSQRGDPGVPTPPKAPEEVLAVFTPIDDAAGALAEVCPNMPVGQG
jgi:hypothetical protein